MRNCVTVSVFTGAIGLTVSFFFLTGLSVSFFTAMRALLSSHIRDVRDVRDVRDSQSLCEPAILTVLQTAAQHLLFVHLLFVAQGDDGIDAHRATCWNVTCCERDPGQHDRHGYERQRINRVNPSAATRPIATPIRAVLVPSPSTSFRTSWRWAPSAIRIPISCVRCPTKYESTP